MSLVMLKKMARAERGECMNCGHPLHGCQCKTSSYLPKRPRWKRGKRRFGRNDAGNLRWWLPEIFRK